jgi:hypothetical protein
VPAIDDSVRLRAEEVRELQPGGTRRKPGIGIFVGDNRNLRFIIVGSDDVAYAPASADSALESPVGFGVSDAPDLVAYSMMESNARHFADSLADNPPRNWISEVHSKIVKILAVGAVSAGQSLHIGRAAAAALVSYSHR